MDKYRHLREFCYNAHIYSRIKNALWNANGYGDGNGRFYAPIEWEPNFDDFLNLNPKTIIGISAVSLAILRN